MRPVAAITDGRHGKPLRILYLCTDLGIPVLGNTGAAVHIQSMVTAFARVGHAVTLCAPLLKKHWFGSVELAARVLHLPPPEPNRGDGSEHLQFYCELLDCSPPEQLGDREQRHLEYNAHAVATLIELYRNEPPDFIYERTSLFGVTGLALADALQLPLILELNNPPCFEQTSYQGNRLSPLAFIAERAVLRRADAVLPVCCQLRDYVQSAGVASEKITVIPDGVDLTRFAADSTRTNNDERTLGFVSGLRPWHDVAALPALLEGLAGRFPVRLVVVGDGPRRAELETELRARNLLDRTIFTGAVAHADVPAFIRQFDVGLVPYPRPERSFYFSPLKLFEYMACGIAVVAADVGQIREVIRHGENGLLYEPGNSQQLLAACARLLADEPLRRRLGQAAAAEASAKYSWESHAATVIDLAQSLCSRRREC